MKARLFVIEHDREKTQVVCRCEQPNEAANQREKKKREKKEGEKITQNPHWQKE